MKLPVFSLSEFVLQGAEHCIRLLESRVVPPFVIRLIINLFVTTLFNVVAHRRHQGFDLSRDALPARLQSTCGGQKTNQSDAQEETCKPVSSPAPGPFPSAFILHPCVHTSIQGVGSLGNERVISVSAGKSGARS